MRQCFGVFACVALLFGVVSCRGRTVPEAPQAANLREAALLLEARRTWSQELRPQGRDGADSEVFSGTAPASPVAFIAESMEGGEASVYPRLPGFASLDTSAYSEAQLRMLRAFCEALVAGKTLDPYMAQGALYEAVLFRYNLPAADATVDSYCLGEAFVAGEDWQCPVRLFRKAARVCDIFVYLRQEGGAWKVTQIEFFHGEP